MSKTSPTLREPAVVAPASINEDRAQRPLGQLMCELRGMRPAQVHRVLDYQQHRGLRFGEAAIALGLLSEEELLEVLSIQFRSGYVGSFGNGNSDHELVSACDPLGADAEAFRGLRTELLSGVLAGTVRSLAVLSPQARDGRTYVAANLAIALAQLGRSTLLLDADMRTPRQHRLFGVPDAGGLSTLLAGRVDRCEVIAQLAELPTLSLLPAGPRPPNPSELLHRAAFERLLLECNDDYEFVIIDTPAVEHGSDARIVAAAAGAALVVARRHVSRTAELQRLLPAIAKTARLAGVLVNDF